MPARVGVVLTPRGELDLAELRPDRLHALFFSLSGGDLAQELHRSAKVKPFSLSFSALLRDRRRVPIPPGEGEGTVEKIFVRVSFLEESLFARFLSSFILGKDPELRLGHTPLHRSKRPLIRECDVKSYRTIYEEAEPRQTFCLDFLTPTSFKRGTADYPLPDPLLIFRGLIRKWQRFSDLKIDTDLREVIEKKLQISFVSIRSRKVALSDLGKITGYTGRAVLFVSEENPTAVRWINALAEFAEFAGVGRKTTMGFGTVRFSKSESDHVSEGGDEE